MTEAPPTQIPAAVRPRDEAPPAIVDLRERRSMQVALTLFSPDLAKVVHASHGFGAHVTAQLAAARGPRSFSYAANDLAGVERTFEARVVVPYGAGRPVVIHVWPDDLEPASGPCGPHAELAAALAKLDDPLDAAATLDTYLHCVLDATGTDAVVAVHVGAGHATVVGAAGDTELLPGHRSGESPLRAAFPHVLASADSDDDHVILGRSVGPPGSSGWLGGAALRATRSRHGSSTSPGAVPPHEAAVPTVVYLDDDPGSLELMVEFFRLLPSLELVPVKNEREAHEAIVVHRPAVVLVDAWLGDRSADAFVRDILAGSQLEVPAVVILSADANASTIARFRRLGVTSYLSKPIELGYLFAVVDALARSDEREEGNGSNARTIATFGN